MNKIYMSIILIFSLLLLTSCFKGVKEDLGIPRIITDDFQFPTEYKDSEVVWYLDGILIENGYFPYPDNVLAKEVIFEAHIDDDIYRYEVLIESRLSYVSEIFIDTNNIPIVSKDDYVNATLTLKNKGIILHENLPLRIKGRGNSTWGHPKKPYKLKFDERTSLLDMPNVKEYVLLAEYGDKSLMRNYVAHQLASYLEVGYTLETRFVEVYLNEEYNGFYLMTEQVEVDKNKLSIESSDLADGGILFELESDDRINDEGIENIDWFRVSNKNYVIKSPDSEDYSVAVMNQKANYMIEYIEAFEDSIDNNTFEDYIDVDSFIDYFIVQELTKNVDSGYSSVYSFKDKDGLLTMGPLWDFDISLGNGDYFDSTPVGFHAYGYNLWFTMLMDNSTFKQRYVSRYNEVVDLYIPELLNDLRIARELTYDARVKNFTKWDILNSYVWPNPEVLVKANTVTKQDDFLENYIVERVEWLTDEYN